MNKDFHYYGTYHAARIAGYNQKEAGKIAFFAQFVDECTKTKITTLMKEAGYKTEDNAPIITVQSTDGMIKKYEKSALAFKEEELKEILEVWCPFHFLPGGEKPLTFETRENDNEKKADAAKLICCPNSNLVIRMINKLMEESSKLTPYAYIGMVMHVLADTWAHQRFAGVPASYLNDAESPVYNKDNKKISFQYLGIDNKYTHSCTPVGPRENSLSYLGHGRMGHLPDLGYMVYTYKPVWSSQSITVNNTENFTHALAQMVYVMSCIKGNKAFDKDVFVSYVGEEGSETKSKIDAAVRVLTEEGDENTICNEMQKFLNKNWDTFALPPFSTDEFFKKEDSAWGDLWQFFRASEMHREMVLDDCKEALNAYFAAHDLLPYNTQVKQ